jgi:MFS family permease
VSLWRNRDFVLLWTGQTVSVFGSTVSTLAFPLLVLAITQSPAQAGVTAFVAGLPRVVFQLPAGAWVDRWDRRRVMVGCDFGRLLAIASIPLVGVTIGVSFAQLLITALVHGTLSVFFVLAERAALPHVVDSDALPTAVARNQAKIQGAMIAGPPLGGLLFGISRVLPFVVDAASYVISLITLIGIRAPLQDPPAARTGRLRHDIAVGVRFVWADRCLRALSLVSAAVSLLTAGIPLVFIVLATHLRASPTLIGVILGVSGAGGLLGAALAPYLVRTVAAGVLNLVGLWLWTGLILAMAMIGTAVVLGPVAAGFAVVGPALAVVAQTRRTRLVPRHLLGRVYSVNILISRGTAPLGSLLAGLLLSSVGPSTTVVILGAGLGVVALAATASPTIRHADLPETTSSH